MARKAKKKVQTKKAANRKVKKTKRTAGKKRKTPARAKAAKARKTNKKTAAEIDATAMDNMAYGLGYLIP